MHCNRLVNSQFNDTSWFTTTQKKKKTMNFPGRLLFHLFNLFFCTFPFHVTFTFLEGSHLLTYFTDLTRPFSSLSHFLPFSRYPFGLSRSTPRLALLKKKKLIIQFFVSSQDLGALKFLKSGSPQKKKIYIIKKSWKFLVIFPKRSTEISSLPNFQVLSKFSPQSSLSSFAKFQIGFGAFSKHAGLVGDQGISSSLIYLSFNRFLVLNF